MVLKLKLKRVPISYALVALLTIIALTLSLFFSTPPVAAAGCSGTGCDGKDPVQMGCSGDAYTVNSADIRNSSNQVIGRVDLRWSPSCKTNWGKVVSYVGSANLFVMLTYCNDSEVSGTYYQLSGSTSVFGDMKYNTTVRAKGAFGLNHASDMFASTGCY
jgi:hypothetical protein